jgi:hypothetical protein
MRLTHGERRVLAGLGAFSAGFGVFVAGTLGPLMAGALAFGGDPYVSRLLAVPIVLLTVAVCILGVRTTESAWRYMCARPDGRGVGRLVLATWVLWFLWAIPTNAWFAAGLVLYTPMALACVAAALLAWRLVTLART